VKGEQIAPIRINKGERRKKDNQGKGEGGGGYSHNDLHGLE